MRLSLFAPASILLAASLVAAQQPRPHNYVPPNGYVPDAETAVQIAVAVWSPIYGREKIEQEKPYRAVLKGDVWTVVGSLPSAYQLGGVAEIEISKKDGRVLRVTHGK
ncbi:hypothetical protein BWI17_00660 [Betaproteobacteria bacterium GR16-43]|nr:hypothetical protein BWI17_00660 [Betaproteobacteria bacterium GR16-43]